MTVKCGGIFVHILVCSQNRSQIFHRVLVRHDSSVKVDLVDVLSYLQVFTTDIICNYHVLEYNIKCKWWDVQQVKRYTTLLTMSDGYLIRLMVFSSGSTLQGSVGQTERSHINLTKPGCFFIHNIRVVTILVTLIFPSLPCSEHMTAILGRKQTLLVGHVQWHLVLSVTTN